MTSPSDQYDEQIIAQYPQIASQDTRIILTAFGHVTRRLCAIEEQLGMHEKEHAGDFADVSNKELLLMRDRMGQETIKPGVVDRYLSIESEILRRMSA